MNKTQRIVLILLLLSTLFSIVSIFISFTASNFELPKRQVSGHAVNSGGAGLSFYVEGPGNPRGRG